MSGSLAGLDTGSGEPSSSEFTVTARAPITLAGWFVTSNSGAVLGTCAMQACPSTPQRAK